MQAPIPQPRPLLNAFAENDVVLYGGGGLSAESGFPLWGEFVESLLLFAEERKAVDPSFAESLHATLRDRKTDFVANSVVSALGERRPGELQAHLREMFHRPDASLSPVHAVLRGLRFRAAMTTNFDDLLKKTLPTAVARRVQALAKRRRTSANRVLVDLIESGLEAKEREKVAFFELADQLALTSDRAEQKRLKEELARMTFGE